MVTNVPELTRKQIMRYIPLTMSNFYSMKYRSFSNNNL